MGGNCEIVEEKDEPSTTRQTINHLRSQERDTKPPIQKKVPNKFLEDDINKLFESVNLRTTKSLDLTDSWRNASKKPMGATGYHSPVGFSESVSLKQALRGLCISQAAEMAAAKRFASPRISEVGKFSNLIKSATQSSCSSPSSSVQPTIKNIECISIDIPANEMKPAKQNGDPTPQFHHIAIDNVSKEEKPVSVSIKEASARIERSLVVVVVVVVVENTTPKLRRKSRLQIVSSSSEVKGNKETKSTKSNSRAIKPVVIKKSVKLAVTNTRNSKALDEVNSGQLVCQKCNCSMKDAKISTSKPDSVPVITENEDTASMKTISNEKVNISQSSKSSICDFSSSNTSLSEESNLSRSSFGTRPHMSTDMRWGAISRIKKHFGFLGLSHFNLLKKLGAGDIGTVYLAELIGTNCSFAIKVMDNEFLARRKKTARVQTEREILRMLDHPFLPTLFAQFTSDNLSCLVMEFCPGGDLHVLRQKQPDRYFPEQAARFYAAEVLLALEYLHMLGIIYRDLKPENIMVREDGHIMLTDFDLSLRCSVNPTLIRSSGIVEPPRMSGPCAGANCVDPFCAGPSCQMSCFSPRILPTSSRARKLKAEAKSLPRFVAEPKEARSNSFVGTHEYLAPEIIKGEGHGSAVDWWTFGILLYELLYGKTPFKGAGNDETLDNVILQNFKFPDSPIVSFQARDLIRGLLVKDPENRLGTEMGSAEIKRHPFFEGLNWALIRCAVPPQIPESYEVGGSEIEYQGKDGHLEFELF